MKNLFHRIILAVIFISICIYAVKNVINPYIAYKIAEHDTAGALSLKKAMRLDPGNDRYYFMLSKILVAQARMDKGKARENLDSAVRHIKEAIRLNPWNENYAPYLEWVIKMLNE